MDNDNTSWWFLFIVIIYLTMEISATQERVDKLESCPQCQEQSE